MAKPDKLGGLGRKPLAAKPAAERRKTDPAGTRFHRRPQLTGETVPVGLREKEYDQRLRAFVLTSEALQTLTVLERTQVLAAVAEFFQLSVRVEN